MQIYEEEKDYANIMKLLQRKREYQKRSKRSKIRVENNIFKVKIFDIIHIT